MAKEDVIRKVEAVIAAPTACAEMTALADQKLAAGETICFCPGCQAGQAVLDIADEL